MTTSTPRSWSFFDRSSLRRLEGAFIVTKRGGFVVLVGLVLYGIAVLLSLYPIWTNGPAEGRSLPVIILTLPFATVGVSMLDGEGRHPAGIVLCALMVLGGASLYSWLFYRWVRRLTKV
jgi:hypothetical protein